MRRANATVITTQQRGTLLRGENEIELACAESQFSAAAVCGMAVGFGLAGIVEVLLSKPAQRGVRTQEKRSQKRPPVQAWELPLQLFHFKKKSWFIAGRNIDAARDELGTRFRGATEAHSLNTGQ